MTTHRNYGPNYRIRSGRIHHENGLHSDRRVIHIVDYRFYILLLDRCSHNATAIDFLARIQSVRTRRADGLRPDYHAVLDIVSASCFPFHLWFGFLKSPSRDHLFHSN
jgi:hypothetical protein